MYGRVGTTAFMAAPAGTLAVGGLDVLWWTVACCTLIAAALAVRRLLPARAARALGSERTRRPRRRLSGRSGGSR